MMPDLVEKVVSDGCDGCAGGTDWDARRSVSERIGSLEAGDFFHAGGVTRAGMICLVTRVTRTGITARQVPPLAPTCKFDRVTGKRLPDQFYSVDDDGSCSIDSVEPLPMPLHTRLLDMDRRDRLRPMQNRLPAQSANWKAVSRAYDHYAAHRFDVSAAEEGAK